VFEQDCISKVIGNNARGEADQVLWIPQWKINAYPEEITCLDKANRSWERGLFVMHFAGAGVYVKLEDGDAKGFLMRKYEAEII
jgi:mannan polymerase II complex MNN10 subunit